MFGNRTVFLLWYLHVLVVDMKWVFVVLMFVGCVYTWVLQSWWSDFMRLYSFFFFSPLFWAFVYLVFLLGWCFFSEVRESIDIFFRNWLNCCLLLVLESSWVVLSYCCWNMILSSPFLFFFFFVIVVKHLSLSICFEFSSALRCLGLYSK